MIPGSLSRKHPDLATLFTDRTRIIVVGVINVTPDSFSDGGRFLSRDAAVQHAILLAREGADILDIGGESSRPGSGPVSVTEELNRVLPVIEKLTAEVQVPISIDTYKAEVAEAALRAGASIINDITALSDQEMVALAAQYGAGVILMHKRGTPKEMQSNTRYDDLLGEICEFLAVAINRAEKGGVRGDQIMIDPGIGFGKDLDGNLALIQSIGELRRLGKPVLAGASRKSFIGGITGAKADDRLGGSLAAAVAAVLNGVDAVRVHDVAITRQAVDVAIRLRR